MMEVDRPGVSCVNITPDENKNKCDSSSVVGLVAGRGENPDGLGECVVGWCVNFFVYACTL